MGGHWKAKREERGETTIPWAVAFSSASFLSLSAQASAAFLPTDRRRRFPRSRHSKY